MAAAAAREELRLAVARKSVAMAAAEAAERAVAAVTAAREAAMADLEAAMAQHTTAAAAAASASDEEAGEETRPADECPVCLIELNGVPKKAYIPCGHTVCAACADKGCCAACPVCRTKVQGLLKLY